MSAPSTARLSRRTEARRRGRGWPGCRRHCRRTRAAPLSWLAVLAAPYQRDADVAEDRGDGCMRLVDRHAYRPYLRKLRQDGVGHATGGGFDQPEALRVEGLLRAIDDLVVGDRVNDLVRARGGGELDVELKVEREGLPDL